MRNNPLLLLRYRAIVDYVGVTLMVVGAAELAPLAVLIAWPDESSAAPAFLIPGLTALAAGWLLFRRFRPREAVLTLQEGGVLVLLSWLVACLVGAIPLMAAQKLNFTQAVFESVSGWTTTGLSVVDVAQASNMVLLYRSVLQLIGGAGFAIIMVATLVGPGGPGVSDAEGRDLLVPHVRKSAKLVLTIYTAYVAAVTLAYIPAGMTAFDALNHSFAAVSTGGFSTRPESIGYWDSPAVEAVTIVGMLLGQTSFVTAYIAFRGNPRAALRDGEVRYSLIFWPLCAAALFAFTTYGLYTSSGKAVRVAVFEAATAMTTTGFSTVGYSQWNAMGIFLLILAMIVGGGTCSTAGGMKQYRFHLMCKAIWWDFRKMLLPRDAVTEDRIWRGDAPAYIGDSHLRRVGVFCFLYLLCFAAGSLVLAAYGYSLQDSMFEFASSLGTVGISVGVTAPNAPSLVLWTETLGMFLGRLEFFVVFAGAAKLSRDLWILIRSRSFNCER